MGIFLLRANIINILLIQFIESGGNIETVEVELLSKTVTLIIINKAREEIKPNC